MKPVSIEHVQRADGSVEPRKINVVASSASEPFVSLLTLSKIKLGSPSSKVPDGV